jgi:Fic family protein
MSWDPQIPFNELPALPPTGLDLEPRAVLKATIEARAALATVAQAGRALPNPAVLIHAVPLLEAQASSEIENIVTTADELFKHVEIGGGNHATKEALRYRTALFAGVDAIRSRPLTARTAGLICSSLHGHEVDVRAVPGTRIANPGTGQVIYAPPEGKSVIRDKLRAWERFVHAEDDLDPLVRMAVAHYQFEAIHPFHDGNGRTGRVINILMLMEAGLLQEPILYLSRSIIAGKNDYYRLLRNVTAESGWQDLLMY